MATTQGPDRDGIKRTELLGHLPIIDLPFSRVAEHWFTFQNGPCAEYELDFARCSARVGIGRTPVECKKFHNDFMECAYRFKTLMRYKLMQDERRKQGAPYMEKPPPDSVRTFVQRTS